MQLVYYSVPTPVLHQVRRWANVNKALVWAEKVDRERHDITVRLLTPFSWAGTTQIRKRHLSQLVGAEPS